jgi:hypothetical protein
MASLPVLHSPKERDLFQNTSSLFIKGITTYHLPDKFKVPDIPVYSGLGDPIEHLENLRAHLNLHGTPDEVACLQSFPTHACGKCSVMV